MLCWFRLEGEVMEKNINNRMMDPRDLENRESDHVQARRARIERHKRALRRLPTEELADARRAPGVEAGPTEDGAGGVADASTSRGCSE